MFRAMRRKRQEISQEECREILRRGSHCVLGLLGDNGYPYTVPVNYVYLEDDGLGRIVFHGAKSGHKMDAIRRDDRVSLCVVDRDTVLPALRATRFASVIAFGRARLLETEEELRRAAMAVGARFSPGYEQDCREETEDTIRRGTLGCVEIVLEHMTGKISLDLLQEREKSGER